ncbi:MAG: flagellar hook-basal body complex protein FliE [Candidatus Sericytochromatia bacterium]|nr:flagellar hook-basal body complex protein FliE [Candidatus Sericytochromatia bacterium]
MITGLSTNRPRVDAFAAFDTEFATPLGRAGGLAFSEGVAPTDGLRDLTAAEGPSFGQVLRDALEGVEREKARAEAITLDFATGKPVDIHTMMIQVAKADVMMQVTSAVVSKSATSLNQLLQTQV